MTERFCDMCGAQVSQQDLEEGLAVEVAGVFFCPGCAPDETGGKSTTRQNPAVRHSSRRMRQAQSADAVTAVLLIAGLILMLIVGTALIYYMTRSPAYVPAGHSVDTPARTEDPPARPKDIAEKGRAGEAEAPPVPTRRPLGEDLPDPVPVPPITKQPPRESPTPGEETARTESEPPDTSMTEQKSEAAPGAEWIRIFDGQSFDDWRHRGNAYIEEGALVSENGQDIYYPAEWAEYVLDCEMKGETGNVQGEAVGMISLSHRGFGRGGTRVLARFHRDGDCHITTHSKVFGRSGSGKFPMGEWLSIRLEIKRDRFRIYRDDRLMMDADISEVPMQKGGVQFYSEGGARFLLRNARVRVISY